MLEEYQTAARPADEGRRADARLEQPGHDPAGRRNDADGQALRRPRADRRRPVGRPHSGQRAAARLRLLRLLRPQDLRPDGHRRGLRQGRTARDPAALARWRQHDPQRDVRRNDATPTRRPSSKPARRTSPTPSAWARRSTTSIASACRTSPPTSTNCWSTRPSGCRSIDGLRLIGTAREKVGVLSFVLPESPHGRRRPAARPGRDRRPRRPPLLAAVAAALRRRIDRPAVAVVLQHEERNRPPGRCRPANCPNALTTAASCRQRIRRGWRGRLCSRRDR